MNPRPARVADEPTPTLRPNRRFRTLAALAACALIAATGGCGGEGGAGEASRSAVKKADAVETAMDPELAQAGVTPLDLQGAHEPPLDRFHPDKREVRPALGGRVIQHIASEPPSLNFAIDQSAVIRWIHRCIHAGLLEFDLSTWEYDPVLARSYDVEDTILLKGGRGEENSNIAYGIVRDDGDHWSVSPGSAANRTGEQRIPKSDVESVQAGTVFTFHLRDDVYWHDGEKFDADDVIFSWEIYFNPAVDCDEKRALMQMVVHGERIDDYTVRFFYKEQYFMAVQRFGLDFCLLPSHLYNLQDPTNADYDPDATQLEQGDWINDNRHNNDFVGLGPYKLETWERGRYLEAKKFDKFFDPDPAYAGYMDTIRWTVVDDDNLAFQALLNNEVDIFDRVKSEDFLGAATKQDVFVKGFYKAYTYVGTLGYTGWNMYSPKLSDVRVRTALSYAFDVKDWIRTNYEGLALPATSTMFWFGPAYNHDVKANPYDPEKAQELLADAGWYDRNGNGIADKDGQELSIEALMPTGNKASEKLLQKMQESFEQVGVQLTIHSLEWASFLERILDRNFDACNLAWALSDVESDPYQLWHSSEAVHDRRTSNHSGLSDEVVDDLIERGRRELDPEKRHAIWHQLHARIYELQPYLFGWNVPRKIAFNKNLRGVKLYKFSPGYNPRDFYYEEGTPGTRPLESRT